MSRLNLYRAIRELPEEWIDEDTLLSEFQEDCVVCLNQKWKAMIWKAGQGWRDMKIGAPDETQAKVIP